jgi:endonuclease YncB( thermonuclease family)
MNPSLFRVIGAAALCLASIPAPAQNGAVAPAPPAVPVGEVNGAPISPAAAGRTIEGMATVIDGDELRIGDRLVRLFGIAAPDISANDGPDARLYLDGLAGGQRVSCREVDRSEDDESIAICSIDGTDLAPELLSQGLAAVYRIGTGATLAERERAARYDLEESDARARKLGIWAPRNAAPQEAASPAHPLADWRDAVPKWLEQAPLLALLALLGIIGLALLGRRSSAPAREEPIDDGALTAALLAEVSAIRDSAQEQYDGTAALPQDAPIPASQQGMLGLPRAAVFSANADRIDLLPGELAAKLVRFYALHDSVAHLLQRAGAIRCDTIRASLHGLTQSADQALAAG